MAIKTKLEDMQIGDKILCDFYANSGSLDPNNHFKNIGLSNYPSSLSDAVGSFNIGIIRAFYFIFVGKDFKGRMILIADRNVAHTISWDQLNTMGYATKSGVPITSLGLDPTLWKTHIRLLTGGTSDATKVNSEWDKYIVNGTGGGQYPVGDNATWNWSGLYSWTSTTISNISGSRAIRGSSSASKFAGENTNSSITQLGFRPVLVAESLKAPITNKYLIQDGQEIKKYGTTKVNVERSAITAMTSLTAPSPFVVASNGQVTGNEAWKAFDKTNALWMTPSTSGWISYKFDVAKTITRYSIKSAGGTSDIKDYTIQGSNDNSTWTVLDTYATPQASYSTLSRDITNPGSYLYYKVVFTSNWGYTQSGINEIDYIEIVQQDSGPSWQIIGTAPATKTMFDTHGMTDLSIVNDAAIQSLTSTAPELLCWTDEEGEKTYSNDVIPLMTTNSTPSGIASASSEYGTAYSPWVAFNNDSNRPWITSTGIKTGWIAYEFPTPVIIESYAISKLTNDNAGATGAPKDWTFEGYDELNSGWVILDQRVGESGWNATVSVGDRRVYVFQNNNAFRKYRLNVTANNGNVNFLAVGELEMMEVASTSIPSRTATTTAIPKPTLLLPVGDIELGEVQSVKVEAILQRAVNAILPMTASNAPSPLVATASNEANSSYAAWKAFDGKADNATTYWSTTSGVVSGWLKLDFGTPKVINKYVIKDRSPTGDNSTPKNWTFEGSNDNSNWTVLDTQTAQGPNTTTGVRSFSISNNSSYRYYRLNVSLVNGGSYVIIGELEMYEKPSASDIKLLVSGDSGVTWKGLQVGSYTSDLCTGGSALGSGSLSGWSELQAFDNTTSTRWASAQSTTTAGLAWIGYDLGSNVSKHIRKIRLLTSSISDVNISSVKVQYSLDNVNWVDVITASLNTAASVWNDIILPPTIAARYWRLLANSNPVVPNGNPWQVSEVEMMEYSSSAILSVNPNNMTDTTANGFTPGQINALTKEELASLFPNGKARFAFYLEQEKSTDIVEVQSLKINEKQFTLTPEITSLSVLYDLLKSEKPKYYVSRNDGVDWKEVEPDQLTKLDDLPSGKKLRVKAVLTNGQELHGLSYSWI